MATTAVVIRFDGNALRQVTLAGAADDITRRANRVQNDARSRVPVDTGRLRNSIVVEYFTAPGGAPAARIGSNLEYALFRHEGTGIYGPRGQMIRPRSGRFMVWPVKNNSGSGNRRYSGGRTSRYAFARQTRGTPGVPFLLLALDAAR